MQKEMHTAAASPIHCSKVGNNDAFLRHRFLANAKKHATQRMTRSICKKLNLPHHPLRIPPGRKEAASTVSKAALSAMKSARPRRNE